MVIMNKELLPPRLHSTRYLEYSIAVRQIMKLCRRTVLLLVCISAEAMLLTTLTEVHNLMILFVL